MFLTYVLILTTEFYAGNWIVPFARGEEDGIAPNSMRRRGISSRRTTGKYQHRSCVAFIYETVLDEFGVAGLHCEDAVGWQHAEVAAMQASKLEWNSNERKSRRFSLRFWNRLVRKLMIFVDA